MSGRHFLAIPGPTNIPDRILRRHARDDGRPSQPGFSQSVPAAVRRSEEALQDQQPAQPFIFPATGTGAWEAVLVNTLSAGDRVLSSRFGQFSHLWIDLAQRHGLDVVVQQEPWGTGASPERIHDALAADTAHAIKAVMVVQNETATGVTSDIAAVRRAIDAAGHPCLAVCGWRQLYWLHRFPHG